ncbi:MAG: hypothetical protein KBD51_01285 [Candidatus Levybacteria bacterium]|nr:hypothetical protein [Candidatus Levybacteria bacterium]
MTERKERRTPSGLKIRRVYMQPETVIQIVPPGGAKVLDQEAEKARRAAALEGARDYFHGNAQDIAFLMGGGVEDADRVHLDSAVELRTVTLGLMDTGIGTDDVIRDVRRSILAKPGMIDPILALDAAKSYGRLLESERERVLEERIAQEGVPAPKAPLRAPRSPRS